MRFFVMAFALYSSFGVAEHAPQSAAQPKTPSRPPVAACKYTAEDRKALDEALAAFASLKQKPFSEDWATVSTTKNGKVETKPIDVQDVLQQKRLAILEKAIPTILKQPACVAQEIKKFERVLVAERGGEDLVYLPVQIETDHHNQLAGKIVAVVNAAYAGEIPSGDPSQSWSVSLGKDAGEDSLLWGRAQVEIYRNVRHLTGDPKGDTVLAQPDLRFEDFKEVAADKGYRSTLRIRVTPASALVKKWFEDRKDVGPAWLRESAWQDLTPKQVKLYTSSDDEIGTIGKLEKTDEKGSVYAFEVKSDRSLGGRKATVIMLINAQLNHQWMATHSSLNIPQSE